MRLRFLSAGAAQGLVDALARQAAIEVAGSFGAVGAMLEKFDAGEDCDLVILTRKQVDALAARGRVEVATIADLGVVPTSIAVRAGDSEPDVSTGQELRAALLAADAIYFPDPARATAGIHFASVIDALGIRAQVDGRLKTYPNGATAMRALAQAAGHPIGCTQATEILATPGVQLVAALPPGHDLNTVYTAAASANASEPRAAADFIAVLNGEASRAQRAAAGFR